MPCFGDEFQALDFHKQAFSELLENDGLLVMAKGLGLHEVITKFLKLYGSPDSNRRLAPKRKKARKGAAENANPKSPLVIVLNARNDANRLVHSLRLDGVVESELPRILDTTILIEARLRMFEQGGCYFVSTSTFVVDLLKKRLDPTRITGFLVLNSEQVTETSSVALILRIFRQANFVGADKPGSSSDHRKDSQARLVNGFIKAFSEKPESLSSGFGKLSQTLTNLGVRKVYLWPRFHSIVKENLKLKSPEVLELSQPLTPMMETIQNAVVEAMSACLSELRKTANIDISEFNVESSLFRSFDVTLRRQLDPLWHKIGYKSKQLVADLGVLRRLLPALLHHDCISFYKHLQSIQRESQRSTSPALWLLTDAADRLFTAAKARMYQVVPVRELAKTRPQEVETIVNENLFHQDGGVSKCIKVSLEENPKWSLLREVLDEIQTEIARVPSKLTTGCDILVLCNDASTATRLESYLDASCYKISSAEGSAAKSGSNTDSFENHDILGTSTELVKTRFLRYIEKIIVNCLKLQAQLGDVYQDGGNSKPTSNQQKTTSNQRKASSGKSRGTTGSAITTTAFGVQGAIQHKRNKVKEKKFDSEVPDVSRDKLEKVILNSIHNVKFTRTWRNLAPKENPQGVTLSNGGGFVAFRDLELSTEQKLLLSLYENVVKDMRKKRGRFGKINVQSRGQALHSSVDGSKTTDRFRLLNRTHVVIQSRSSSSAVGSSLRELNPRFVIIFDPSVHAIREVEVFQAQHQKHTLRVYFLIYQNSVEEQRYLADLKREQTAFKSLIEEKANLVLPELAGGIVHDPNQDSEQFAPTIIGYNISTGEPILSNGRTGKRTSAGTDGDGPPRVVVDMREFRSALPILLHREGVIIDPITLEVGDYILTPDMCMERKSISDLFGSFNSGRLYKQAEAMSRFYKQPGLLIEFDEDRPFSLQSVAAIDNDVSMKSITSKLVLLTLHFPEMRLFWSPKPRATVRLFKLLKANYKNPDAEVAQLVGVPQLDPNETVQPGDKRRLAGNVAVSESAGVSGNIAAQDLLRRLPGVTLHNFYPLMEKAKSLRGLVNLSVDDLSEVMGSIQGEKLYKFLRQSSPTS